VRGFAVGGLALIALYVAVQPNNAKAATAGSNALVGLLRRFLASNVAGIPQRKPAAAATPASTSFGGGTASPTVPALINT
jgi:hypothetical protein